MSEPKITKIYLALTRGFHYNPKDEALNSKFNFLADNNKFYEKAIQDIDYLGTQQDLYIQKVGQLRSVLDTKSTSISGTLGCEPDPFFHQFQEYYTYLASKGQSLLPHYPCVVDILPSNKVKYKINASAFPGSLSEAKIAKLSVSIRLYPVGLASLRLGLFLSTTKSFDVKNIIEFLWQKNGSIDVEGLGTGLSIDKLTKMYGQMLLDGLCKRRNPLSWSFTYSSIDIIESSQLTLEHNYDDVFFPLVNLGKEPENKLIPNNQSRDGDILLFGPKSSVSYLPNNADGNKLMNPDRRKIRRWVRNSVELFSAQQLISNCISATTVAGIFDSLKAEHWMETIKKGILPPAIKQLFSYWNYTHLHLQDFPLIKQDWRNRHSELIRILDENARIVKANKLSMKQLIAISKEASKAQTEVGITIRDLPKIISDYKSALTV